MGKQKMIVILIAIAVMTGLAMADVWQEPTGQNPLAHEHWNLGDSMESSGIDFAFSITNIYQINARGGTSTHRRQGRWTGSYDLEMSADLQRLAGIENGVLYMHSEGTWSRESIDTTAVGAPDGTLFGVNADFAPREAFNIIELWYQQGFWNNTLQLRLGKLDMTGGFECSGCPVSFDGNRYANDENTQFLNGALVNNPTVPFPDYGLGAIAYWNPVESWYFSVAAADAQADKRETGFNTTFHDEDYFLFITETGITPELDSANGPLRGAYRFGVWYDPQPKASLDETRNYRDDTGFYLSFDQLLLKENADPEDDQGLGAFFRYGYGHSRTSAITGFYSFGIEAAGLLEGRDEDVLGVGYAHGVLNDQAASPFTEDYESVMEAYYSAQVTPCIHLSPSVQYVANPGGVSGPSNAVIFGVRTFVTF